MVGVNFKVTLAPSNRQFEIAEGSTILDAAARSQLSLAHGCRDGSCGSCKSRVLSGQISHPDNCAGITPDELAKGYVLSCVATADSDIQLESDWYPELDGIKAALFPCKVDSISFPASDIAILTLRLPADSIVNYLPGQYIDLIWKGLRRSYSIACANTQGAGLELHIRQLAHGVFSDLVFNQLKPGTLLRLEGPHGTFFVRDSEAPIIFLAGGTGFAPIKAMIERLFEQHSTRSIHLYWGAASVDHLYSGLPDEWHKKYQNFSYTPVISSDDTGWSGHRGLVHQAVLDDHSDLRPFEVYACGSADMITVAKTEFVGRRLLAEHFFSDAFTAHKPNK
ncbi:MAG: 2Fe-2S iron-sulfur cluster binding domain-containing protein [Gammaproteobacteria bacterium]|nr:2Fe-2S iron-sulfur cluster binding domain-containing protein [Gammaproteobacteria bacterium]